MSHKAEGFWRYNPILQKPTTLEPVMPWGPYWYYGPDPAAGVSYGCYREEIPGVEVPLEILTVKSGMVYSPMTGKPMMFIKDIKEEDVLACFNPTSSAKESHDCNGCGAKLVSSVTLAKAKVHCTVCGKPTSSSPKEESMSNENRMEALREKIKANIQKRRESAKAAAAEASPEATAEVTPDAARKERIQRIRTKIEAAKRRDNIKKRVRARLEEIRKAKAATNDEEYVSLDQILETVNAEAAPAVEAPKEAPAPAAEVPKVEETVVEVKTEEAPKVEAPVETKPASEEKTEEKKEETEEFMDLDMVLSMVNRRQRIARARALHEKRLAAVRAKMEETVVKVEETKPAVQASEVAPEVAPEAPKVADTPAPEAPVMQVEPEVKPEVEPNMKSEENPVPCEVAPEACPESPMQALEKGAEAMKYEPLASVDSNVTVAKSDIDMILFGENSDNPCWHVVVKGLPTARIPLKAQAEAEVIRDVFVSDEYAANLVEHCVKAGFLPTMKQVNAEFWANYASEKGTGARYKKLAEEAVASEKAKLMASFKEEFLSALAVVTAGMNINFYPEYGNPLKDVLFANLKTVGLPEQTAVAAIEKSFKEGAAPYFEALFDKASEYMTMDRSARTEIAKAIGGAAPIVSTTGELPPATLKEKLAQASVIPAAMGSLRVEASNVLEEGDYKNQLRAAWKAGRK